MALDGKTNTDSHRSRVDGLENGDALSEAIRHFLKSAGDAKLYLRIQFDRAKIVARSLALIAILGIVAAVVAATILITVTVIFCIGISGAFTALCGGRAWAGDLITGVLVLGTLAIAAKVVVARLLWHSRRKTFEEYSRDPSRS